MFTPLVTKNLRRPLGSHLIQTRGLKAWWPVLGTTAAAFEVLSRTSGSRNPPAPATSIAPGLGQGLYFDGTTNQQSTSYTYSNVATDGITVAAWVVYDDVSATGKQENATVICKTRGIVSDQLVFGLCVNGTPPRMRFKIFDGSNAAVLTSTRFDITRRRLHHLVGVFDNGNAQLRLYQDGFLDRSSTSGSVNMSAHSGPVFLGYDENSATTNHLWKGWICDVRLYNRPLSAQDIYSLWHPMTRWILYEEPPMEQVLPGFSWMEGESSGGGGSSAAAISQPQLIVVSS
jgi:hypothetical protein